MHARMTRYEGAASEAIEDTLQTKKGDRGHEGGHVPDRPAERNRHIIISLWQDEEAMRASEDEATRVREEVTGTGETASVERYEVALLSVEQAGEVR